MAAMARFRLRSSFLFIVMAWNKTGSKFGFHCDYEVLMVEAGAEKMCIHTFGFSGFLFED